MYENILFDERSRAFADERYKYFSNVFKTRYERVGRAMQTINAFKKNSSPASGYQTNDSNTFYARSSRVHSSLTA